MRGKKLEFLKKNECERGSKPIIGTGQSPRCQIFVQRLKLLDYIFTENEIVNQSGLHRRCGRKLAIPVGCMNNEVG
jgi:hypothetical protein